MHSENAPTSSIDLNRLLDTCTARLDDPSTRVRAFAIETERERGICVDTDRSEAVDETTFVWVGHGSHPDPERAFADFDAVVASCATFDRRRFFERLAIADRAIPTPSETEAPLLRGRDDIVPMALHEVRGGHPAWVGSTDGAVVVLRLLRGPASRSTITVSELDDPLDPVRLWRRRVLRSWNL
ncbi:hypothetical protein AS850_11560 [Frondihabitans sp. 762G35]|uniref:hypothetical protein n=1 Tax=Frondihabitans sp. 762G35 TaxID=1446794 RepID=UPI000D20C5D4|nr:hypothetical protein [Frondihabitans sp. 762G35]ARC57708.1 hypothetical protein AS850_11560 [Frondihabitans sp. 762G35]